MGKQNISPMPAVGKSYEADDYNWLGKYFEIDGTTYIFAKFASGMSEVVQKYDALTVSYAGTAVFPVSKKVNGISGARVDAKSADAYALVVVFDIVANGDSYVNVSHVATASADWAGKTLSWSADAAGYGNKGRPVTCISRATAGAQVSVTGTTAQFTSANLNAALDAVYANVNGPISNMVASGPVTCVTGKTLSDVYFKFGTAGVIVSAMTAPVKDYLKIGSVITTGGQSQVITAVSTATDGLTAELATAFGTAAIGTGSTSACAKVYIGNMRVKSILD